MAATRERLEAVIRHRMTHIITVTLATGDCPDSVVLNRAVDMILHAIDEYTTAEVGLLTPAERRHVLFEGTS